MKSSMHCVVLFVIGFNAVAQQLPVTVYSPDNGALFAGVNSVFQDSQGWMWFTSSYDVVRYDGHEFARLPLAQGVEMDFCYRIVRAGKELWVLATPYPLLIDGDSLRRLEQPQITPSFTDMLQVDERQYALFDNGLFAYSDHTFEPLIVDESLKFSENAHMIAFDDAHLVTFQSGEALIIFDLIGKRVMRHPMPVDDIRQDQSGKLYLLLKGQGVYVLKTLSEANTVPEIVHYAHIDEPDAKYLEIDAQGNVYLGVPDKSLVRIDPGGTINTFTESDGLPSLWFLDMFCDREGNVWIGFNNGLCKIRNVPWRRYTKDQGLYSNYIFFFEEDEGNVYLGTYSGVNVYSGHHLRQVRMGDTPFECKSMILYPGYKGQSTRELYLLKENLLLKAELDESRFHVSNEHLLAHLPATGLHLVRDFIGAIFIATNAGLYVWHDGKLSQPVPGNTHYHQVFVDSQQRLWAAAFGSALEVYQIEYTDNVIGLREIAMSNSLHSISTIRQVRTIDEDTFGNVYAGTRYKGLYQLSFSKTLLKNIRHFTEDDELKSNSIWGVSIDSRNDCWIATARGINRLDVESGLVKDEGSSAQISTSASIYAARNDLIWVASHPGVILLSRDVQPTTQFEIFITGVTVNAMPWDTAQAMTFDHTENNLYFSFSANTFLDEEEIYYQFRLTHNGQGAWSTATHAHSIQYPALQSGNYEFSVKAVNSLGIESSNSARLSFGILPPLWRRAWFIVVLIFAGLSLVYGLYQYRIKQLMELQRIRNSISRNLHDDIGASLSNINILNALALRHIPDPKKAESYLIQSSEDIQRISESLSDIVWNVNPMNDDLDHVYSHMKRYAADMLEGKNITAHLDFPPPGSKAHLTMDKRRDFFLIFKEAINNMAKYSQATKASIVLREETNMLHLLIEDNGIGFELGKAQAGNGLHNMRLRAANWSASLEIRSVPGNGTEIELKMKIG